jgi:proton-dependent oligopeptide transporter, POT family
MTTSAEFEAPPQKLTGHPRGLYVLFGSEMWERFSYYGMRALLVLYLTGKLNYSRKDALALYATYTGLVYLTPLLGGFLADKVLGQRKAILVGGIVMALGHFAMAFESLLFLAMGLVVLGNGFFKPNISTMVGNLYPAGDTRRDVAYTIFYMGINLGASISPLVCGFLGEKIGWHYGFGAAGIGMVIALIVFLSFQNELVGGYPPGRQEAGLARLTIIDWVHVIVVSAICVGFVYGTLEVWPSIQPYQKYIFYFMGAVAGLALLNVAYHLATAKDKVERMDWNGIAVILIVSIFSIVFWMGFEQAGGTFSLFAKNHTNRVVNGYEFPASFFQSVNPFLIVALAPVMAFLWSIVDATRFRLTSSAKMGVGLILVGLGFVVMYQADKLAGPNGKVGPQWLASVFLLHTIGEICLSPIGLSLVNKLAPARLASLMMASWFLCTAIANYLAGMLEQLLEEFSARNHMTINLWLFLITTTIVPGLILLALTVPLKKMSAGRL